MAKPRQALKYGTFFPAPLYWHTSAVDSHPGEGEGEGEGIHININSSTSSTSTSSRSMSDGAGRGLSVTPGHSFSFLSPKLAMGRGIAPKAVTNALVELSIQVSLTF